VYYSYFGFSENPFNLTPDPRYLYLSGHHKEALDHLLYGIQERKGFVVVTGGIGTGKTTLCRALLRQLGEGTKSALIFSSFITDLELLQQIHQELGIACGAGDLSKKRLMDDLNGFLLENFAFGGNVVVLIDEAQNLPQPVLEQLRMLSNLETEKEKLIQIVLVGQPELADILATPSLRQLDERITVRYHLKPLSRDDVEGYVGHRLAVAGGNGRVRFTGSAVGELYKVSGGNPRRLNALCDRALLIAYARETFKVDRGIVADAVKDMQGGMPPKCNRGGRSIFLKQVAVLASLLLILIWVAWQNKEDIAGSFISYENRSLEPAPENKASGKAGIEGFAPHDVEAAPNNQGMKPHEALDVFLGGPASAAGLLFLNGKAGSLENEAGLRFVHFQVPPEFQVLFRKPFRIHIDASDGNDGQESYLVVLRYDDAGAVLLDTGWGERPVSREFMLDHWSSRVSWLVFGRNETETLSIGSVSPKVAEIQKTLHELGYQNKMHGRYDPSTMTAIRRFQKDTGLKPDGLAGPRTLTLLEMLIPDEEKGGLS
jgi:general secretion pathway protein A